MGTGVPEALTRPGVTPGTVGDPESHKTLRDRRQGESGVQDIPPVPTGDFSYWTEMWSRIESTGTSMEVQTGENHGTGPEVGRSRPGDTDRDHLLRLRGGGEGGALVTETD